MNLTNLISGLEWAKSHPEVAEQIAINGKEYGQERLRRQDMSCYVFRLLIEYQDLIQHE